MLKSAFAANKSVHIQQERIDAGDKKSNGFLQAKSVDLFSPTNVEDLCVATKKVAEVQNWLNREKQSRICLLTGNTGAGKTTTARVLATDMNYDIHEWINPVDIAIISNLGDQYGEDRYPTSQLALFRSFLFQASRYKSVFSTCKKRLLLVEDFPNGLIKDPALFSEILEEYTKYGKSPILFIISDARSGHLNMHYKLFPDHVKERLQITHVEFNPISTTLLQKAMKRCCKLMSELPAENYKVPTKEIIDSIVISSQGDIRNAIINLHFASIVCGRSNLETVPVPATGSTKKTKKFQQSALKSIGCDKTITPFHALGRIFNPKRDDKKCFIHKPDEISDDFISEPRKLQNLVIANYAKHFSDIDNVVIAADALSISDVMLTEYRESDLIISGLDIAVRSVMVGNERPVAGWIPLCKTKHIDKVNKIPTLIKISDSYWISEGLYQTDCSTLLKIITNK